MPARIAFCITTLEPGGAERQLVELVTRLPRDRFSPTVIALSPPPAPPGDETLRKLVEQGIPVSFLGGSSLWQTPQVYRRLGRWLRDQRPDLLQCFLAHANILGTLAVRPRRIPIVAGIRVAEQRPNAHRTLQRWTAPLVDKFVCPSQSVAEFAEQNMRLPREKVLVIPNGVDVTRFVDVPPTPLESLGIPAGRRILLFIGRLEPDKGPQWLLDRMPALAAQLPQHDLLVVGQGPLEAKLRQQAARLRLADRVHFAGWRPDVPRLLAAADLLLLTSSAEGMPNVILEAMAAARPVVALDAHGVEELLGHDSREQVVRHRDVDQFVRAAARLANDPDLARRVGQANRQRAIDRFSLDATAARYAALYDQLLAAAGRQDPPPDR